MKKVNQILNGPTKDLVESLKQDSSLRSDVQNEMILELLRPLKLFNQSHNKMRRDIQLEQCLEFVKYSLIPKNSFLFHKYELSDEVFIILFGTASELVSQTETDLSNDEQKLKTLRYYQNLLKNEAAQITLIKDSVDNIKRSLDADARFQFSNRILRILSADSPTVFCKNQPYYFHSVYPELCLFKCGGVPVPTNEVLGDEDTFTGLRKHSIVTDSECHVMRMKMSDYQIIFADELSQKSAIVKLLKMMGLNQANPSDVEVLSYNMSRIEILKKNQTIIKPSDKNSKGVYIVISGSFELKTPIQKSGIGSTSKEEVPIQDQLRRNYKQDSGGHTDIRLFQLGPGEVFGHEELAQGMSQISVVSLETHSEVYKIKLSAFKELTNYQVLNAIKSHGQNRLKRITLRIQELSSLDGASDRGSMKRDGEAKQGSVTLITVAPIGEGILSQPSLLAEQHKQQPQEQNVQIMRRVRKSTNRYSHSSSPKKQPRSTECDQLKQEQDISQNTSAKKLTHVSTLAIQDSNLSPARSAYDPIPSSTKEGSTEMFQLTFCGLSNPKRRLNGTEIDVLHQWDRNSGMNDQQIDYANPKQFFHLKEMFTETQDGFKLKIAQSRQRQPQVPIVPMQEEQFPASKSSFGQSSNGGSINEIESTILAPQQSISNDGSPIRYGGKSLPIYQSSPLTTNNAHMRLSMSRPKSYNLAQLNEANRVKKAKIAEEKQMVQMTNNSIKFETLDPLVNASRNRMVPLNQETDEQNLLNSYRYSSQIKKRATSSINSPMTTPRKYFQQKEETQILSTSLIFTEGAKRSAGPGVSTQRETFQQEQLLYIQEPFLRYNSLQTRQESSLTSSKGDRTVKQGTKNGFRLNLEAVPANYRVRQSRITNRHFNQSGEYQNQRQQILTPLKQESLFGSLCFSERQTRPQLQNSFDINSR